MNKPGWNSYIGELYKTSNCGKPKNGPVFDSYRRCRARCKYAIRFIKSKEQTMRKESLAKKLSKHKWFWKEIKLINPLFHLLLKLSLGRYILLNSGKNISQVY